VCYGRREALRSRTMVLIDRSENQFVDEIIRSDALSFI
jgi:hypothetical protein